LAEQAVAIGAGAAAGLVLGLLLALVMEMEAAAAESGSNRRSRIPVMGIVPIFDHAPKRRWWQIFRRREAGLA
jgi:hypothetical protein